MALIGLVRIVPAWAYGVVLAVLVLFAGAVHERGVGAAAVQARWDASIADQARVLSHAIAARDDENEQRAKNQAAIAADIQTEHDAEIATIRARLAAAPRLRIGAALCGGPAASASADVPGSGDATDPPGRLVRDDIGRDIDALKLAVETDLATGRACQNEARRNGLAP